MKGDAALQVRDLYVNYGRIRALQGVSLEVKAGQMVVLLGANGAGKSTVLRSVSNLLPYASGGVALWGQPTAGLAPEAVASLGVAHVPEGRGVFAKLSVRENLLMGAYHVPLRARAERFEEVVELFPRLRERWRQRAGNLSGGEQQMLALARALVMKPKLLLLDEPSLGLAPLLARETFAAIRRVNAQGVSVLVVEQNARLALSSCDYAYVLSGGKVSAHGTAEAVMAMREVERAYLGVA